MENEAGALALQVANLFQFAFLISKSASRIIGSKLLQEHLKRRGIEKFFILNDQGNLTTNFTTSDPNLSEHYGALFDSIKSAMVGGFGEEYVKNLFLQNYEKLSSWVEDKKNLALTKSLIPKFE